jgi:DNA mismatch endonuclease (patch repair protein)
MAKVRQRDTKPELAVRSAAHKLGYRFRLHVRQLPGTPDLVFVSRRKVIFVHGCFWHRHEGCSRSTFPKTRPDFWERKFVANVERDRKSAAKLVQLGWDVLTIWECQTSDERDLGALLTRFLEA